MTSATPSEKEPTRRRSAVLRTAGLAVVAVLAVAFVGAWALPNVAGSAFVSVRPIAVLIPDSSGPAVSVAGGSPVHASGLRVGVEVVNGYPLPVVLGSGQTTFHAALYRRDAGGGLTAVWISAADDPALEQVSDSPDMGAGGLPVNRAAVVATGRSSHRIASASDAFRQMASGAAKGVYYLGVWAYGMTATPLPIVVDGAVDLAGIPASLPEPSYPVPVYPAALPS